jgi:hypothetical protein
MKKMNYLWIILVLILALVIGTHLVAIGMILFKIMIGIIGLGLLIIGFYIGRWTKK